MPSQTKSKMTEEEFKFILSIIGLAAIFMYAIVSAICITFGYRGLDMTVLLFVLIYISTKVSLIEILWPDQKKVWLSWGTFITSAFIFVSDIFFLL